ncbi:CBS domain-containing protein [Mesorhizobium sp.]|uniref:CBS domain-containing protein n=1 Tax=Mesorhizobium sp. TaxID=1871066 RepID=UPI000FE3F88B|nr:CBS domain-containing protein [Mesorhizobium sp.]RWG84923.1 MAG: CBS domain-containing protein [Mesorhizobium sp.]RWG90088.1 MAG: CBS domain-containing protein [Mesorhizobium sp.]RWK05108.1 MAG: CBS domain-containing protein [Mesorhizobium sp.]RWK08992.1 MAG: CBS domain-containing protein [Mesorhizobium sp.]RWK19835.1 MAG: CBS domain-containing protein [Mesorhizobium sp.]
MQAQAIMTTPVISIDVSASIAEAADLMLTRKISCLPITRDGAMVGIISEGDFLRRQELGTQRTRPHWLEFLVGPGRIADEYVRANARRVDEVMTTEIVSAPPVATLADIVELMTRHAIKNVPIVEAGKPVGIITRTDLLRALLRILPQSGAATADDELIRKAIVAELQGQAWGDGTLIGVRVDQGVVELSGAIFDERQRQAAVVAAENVEGVREVKDNLFCAGPLSMVLVS